ncbi:hypothetical protein BK671_12370 [Pseudomonas fluorescens]|uniref:Uncharacterized protein n=1 Tax=Pseudomonas fluorescens TaxID=294 RepID=A0A423LHF3_PSEFL|nr:hypothetical protein BK671_12370 [Pseudomonas fluorescens]
MEEYKSFIRFANLYLYFQGDQSRTVVSILREGPVHRDVHAIGVGEIGMSRKKRRFTQRKQKAVPIFFGV